MKNKETLRMEILLEELRDSIRLVAEGHDTLRQDIEKTRIELAQRMDNVDLAVKNLSARVGKLEKGQEELIGRFGLLEIGQSDIKNEVRKIHFRLDDHEARLN